MSVIWLMIPIALAMAGLAVWAFCRAVRSGQLDDLDTPAIRAVLDDDEAPPTRE
ncbi:MAG: cbb3-type cytochrome oxidase assembly protein CcoS [Phycisphaerales bacterium JB040]